MREIKTVTILGANGTMGTRCAGLIAAFGGAKVFMVSRDLSKIKNAKEKAIDSVRTEIIRDRLIPATYDDIEICISESDWVLEIVAEDYETKERVNKLISKYRKPGTIVSTGSSGLSIEKLCSVFDDDGRKHYFGTHFYNPPYKMILCELISHPESDESTENQLKTYLKNTLCRAVITTKDKPAFAGNRVGFQFINEAALYAEKFAEKGGIALIDTILGCHTGRVMPPLATVDLVGLDIHSSIVENLRCNTNDNAHETFTMPNFLSKLIKLGKLGKKTGEGLYKTIKHDNGTKDFLVWDIITESYIKMPSFTIPFIYRMKERIAVADYIGAFDILKNDTSVEANICRYFIARYISYSFSVVGEVVADYQSIDAVMGYGFNWVPASFLIDLLGEEPITDFINQAGLETPAIIKEQISLSKKFYKIQKLLDARSFFRVN